MKKIRISSEAVYFIAIAMLAFSVAMCACTNYGVSMIVAPAYILSLKFPFLTFGQCEYIVQGLLFIVFCILMGKVKLVYFSSFITGLIYGAVLDFWRLVIPHFNANVTPPGSLPTAMNIVYFALGMLLTSVSIALFYGIYLYPQVYDFFVKGISAKFGIDRTKFKMCFDAACLAVSFILTFALFGGICGIGVGTVIITCFNGILIGFFGRLFQKIFIIEPRFNEFAKKFDID